MEILYIFFHESCSNYFLKEVILRGFQVIHVGEYSGELIFENHVGCGMGHGYGFGSFKEGYGISTGAGCAEFWGMGNGVNWYLNDWYPNHSFGKSSGSYLENLIHPDVNCNVLLDFGGYCKDGVFYSFSEYMETFASPYSLS